MSSRYKAMTAREAEDEKRVRDAFMSARSAARRSSLRAAAERTPLASSTPPQQEWRQWPSGISPETRETNKLWDKEMSATIKTIPGLAEKLKSQGLKQKPLYDDSDKTSLEHLLQRIASNLSGNL